MRRKVHPVVTGGVLPPPPLSPSQLSSAPYPMPPPPPHHSRDTPYSMTSDTPHTLDSTLVVTASSTSTDQAPAPDWSRTDPSISSCKGQQQSGAQQGFVVRGGGGGAGQRPLARHPSLGAGSDSPLYVLCPTSPLTAR